MKLLHPFRAAAWLALLMVAGVCTWTAPASAETARVSATISNRSDALLSFSLSEVPGIPLPPSVSIPQPMPKPPTNPPFNPPFYLQVKIPPQQSTTIAIPPGQYRLNTMGSSSIPRAQVAAPEGATNEGHRFKRPALQPPAMVDMLYGYLWITNTDIWLFNLKQNVKQVGKLSLESYQWQMQVPSKPGFQLAGGPESPQLPLPQRLPPPGDMPRPVPLLPPPALKLPATNVPGLPSPSRLR